MPGELLPSSAPAHSIAAPAADQLCRSHHLKLPHPGLNLLSALQAVSKCSDLEDLGSKAACARAGAAFPAKLKEHVQVCQCVCPSCTQLLNLACSLTSSNG